MYPQDPPPPPPAKRRNPKWLVITFLSLIIMFGCAAIGIISCLAAVNAEN